VRLHHISFVNHKTGPGRPVWLHEMLRYYHL